MARPCHGPPADRGGAVRCRALRALVVRRAGVAGLPLPQAALRPAARQADHARGIPRAPRRQPGLHTLRVILGHKGYHEVWLNGGNDWIYRHLHTAARRMEELTCAFPRAEGLKRRALTQAGRELLLAQSSDWAFIMKTGTMAEYAVKRTKEHLTRFTSLYEQLRSGRIDAAGLKDLAGRANLFPGVDYHNLS